ncbi:MAG: LON peptidase substrate-binding domain-containing protein [Verrucomicrobia bacterium]|nr:LON peptidase substrate-binding domain-containing protein [Verrucomicrobiota bacterium]
MSLYPVCHVTPQKTQKQTIRAVAATAGVDFLLIVEMEITIPNEVAVMTLPGVAFFPQALLPLHIFEPRYRQMLQDALDTHRLFAVAGLDVKRLANNFEPAYRIATVGVVRACQGKEDGTSHLLLQGLARVEFTEIVGEEPYRRMKIRALTSEPGATEADNARMRTQLSRLLTTRLRLRGESADGLTRFLRGIDDPEVFVDLAAYNLCADARLKQRLLETLNVHERLELFSDWARREVNALRLQKKLQGELSDENVQNN